jgi:ATP-dependent Clp protease ATP-binding subunit ClpC
VIELTEGAKELLVDKGYDPTMGARPLRRAIQRFIEDPLADEVLKAPMTPGSTVVVERDDAAQQKAKDTGADEELKITILPPMDKGPADEPVPVGGGDESPEPEQPDQPAPEQPSEG